MKDIYIIWIIAGAMGLVLAIALILNLSEWHASFKKELSHLNQEIARTNGREREYWKKRKKRLLLSIIPFVKY